MVVSPQAQVNEAQQQYEETKVPGRGLAPAVAWKRKRGRRRLLLFCLRWRVERRTRTRGVSSSRGSEGQAEAALLAVAVAVTATAPEAATTTTTAMAPLMPTTTTTRTTTAVHSPLQAIALQGCVAAHELSSSTFGKSRAPVGTFQAISLLMRAICGSRGSRGQGGQGGTAPIEARVHLPPLLLGIMPRGLQLPALCLWLQFAARIRRLLWAPCWLCRMELGL